jgi:hypothetical protein
MRRARRKWAEVMTLIQAGKKVGSSTSDPTYLPDDRVTLSRFLLFYGLELGVSSVWNVRTCCVDDTNRELSMGI